MATINQQAFPSASKERLETIADLTDFKHGDLFQAFKNMRAVIVPFVDVAQVIDNQGNVIFPVI